MAGYPVSEPSSGGLRRQLYGTVAVLLVAVGLLGLPQDVREDLSAVLRNTVLTPFVGLNQFIVATRIRAVEIDRLRAIQDSLVAHLMSRSTLSEENRRLRALLDLSEDVGPTWTAARAARPSAQGSESIFLLDVGLRDSIRERAPVITREGLAGVVRQLRPGQAVGMDWTHPEFSASAMSADGLTYGLVESRRGDFREDDRLVLQGTPFNTVLEAGTDILTSGLGGTYPRGIPIGRVDSEFEAEGGWRRSYWVEPFVNPASLTAVLVGRGDSIAADMTSVWSEQDRLTSVERGDFAVTPVDSLQTLLDSIAALRDRIGRLEAGRPPSGGSTNR